MDLAIAIRKFNGALQTNLTDLLTTSADCLDSASDVIDHDFGGMQELAWTAQLDDEQQDQLRGIYSER
jgi:hypothetical protein